MTLFLDRDGVINDEIKDGYVLSWDMFRFSNGVLQALPIFNNKFDRIVIVTNQRCIGRGLLTNEGLDAIHARMLQEITAHHGRIDKIYYCPDVDNSSPCRKPQNGMAMQAKSDFPEIDFQQAVMVGNTLSDMQFGRNLGMKTIFITSTHPEITLPHPLIDERYASLMDYAATIQ
ncbi:D-glycero-D-manno-heptose 1,7-bisphosphate phosphatase [Chitinophaga jiangningensis]|uniref:D,D-heptose 1,7-bisphosphate phosphatase n=1 Tax=Chitinophaga jiangningensis TaxID=1419482 RepID=A0A1M7L251_9BACT|nr:HAD-IIIA family hydrolase [Chitinophaga jiangningensis]SHM71883.1 D-glycero-D-manno-heptose 1,7-bisphosphate phosphatase [Chitinophaga jiangningensis]